MSVAENTGKFADTNVEVTAFGGHALLVRKCKLPENKGSIALPEKSREDTDWHEVLGFGDQVGQKCTKKHAKRFDRPRWIENGYKRGDLVLLPRFHEGIERSPLCEYEYFVEESIVICKMDAADD